MQLGPFLVGEVLGHGAQGVVHRGTHTPTGIEVALKVVPGEPRTVDAFLREIRTIAALDHPRVVRLWGAGTRDDGARWCAMELATGTVADLAIGDWGLVREVALGLTDALAHAHARGVLHLDLKPANLLLGCRDGADEASAGPLAGMRLSDFGVAHHLGERVTRLGGTPAYMAPEQIRRSVERLGPETDLYALGQLVWELCCGRPAWEGQSSEVLAAHLRGVLPPFEPRFPVPVGLRDWLAWLLEPDPSARPQRALEAAYGLPGQAERGTTAPPPRASKAVAATWLDQDDGPLDVDADTSSVPRGRPPPRWADWRRPEPWGRIRWLEGGGLGPAVARPPRFVGRTAERDRLWETFARVRDRQHPRVTLLEGGSGMGVSRLAGWLAERLHELDLATTLQVWHSAEGGPGDGLRAGVSRLGGFSGLVGNDLVLRARDVARGLGGAEPGWSEDLREWLADGTLDPTRLATTAELWRERPLVVLVDDARRASDTLALAERVVAAADRPAAVWFVLVAGTAPGPGDAALDRLRDHPATTGLVLSPLPLPELDRILRGWMGLAGPLADRLLGESAGRPGPAVAAVEALAAAGRLVGGPAGFEVPGYLDPLEIVPGLRRPAEALPVAAAEGRRLLTAGRAADAVEPLLRAVRSPPPEVDADLLAAHGDLAAALRTQPADALARGEASWLRLEVGLTRGLAEEVRTGSDALAAEAERQGWGIAAAHAAELQAWCRLVGAGESTALGGLLEVVARYRSLGLASDADRCAVRHLRAMMTLDPASVAERCRALLAGAPRPETRSRVLHILGSALVRNGREDEGLPVLTGVFEEAEASGDAVLAAWVCLDLSHAVSALGRHEESVRWAMSGVDRARSHGGRLQLALALGAAGDAARRSGALDDAVARYLEAAEEFTRQGVHPGAPVRMAAWVQLLRGDPEGAAHQLGRVAHTPVGRHAPLHTRLVLALDLARGDPGAAERVRALPESGVDEIDAWWATVRTSVGLGPTPESSTTGAV